MASISNVTLVVFIDILDQYSFNRDLTCKYRISSNYEPQSTDRMAIFKLGWNYITEYVAIRHITQFMKDSDCTLTFLCDELPKETSDLYQICYISGTDLCGASTPFQFCAEENPLNKSDITCSRTLCSFENMTKYQIIAEKDDVIRRLRQENNVLKESLKILLSNKTDVTNNYDNDIKELKNLVGSLRIMLLSHDKDINMLKNKITEGGEEYKKLYLEKCKVQKKYEKLKSTYMENKHSQVETAVKELNLDLSELKSLPPFPSIEKQILEP